MLHLQTYFLLLVSSVCCFAQQNAAQPHTLPVVQTSSCPSSMEQGTIHRDIRGQVHDLLGLPLCLCSDQQWTRLVHLNMSSPSQQCPSNWTLVTTPIRGCGRQSRPRGGCDSTTFPVNGRSYSHVCGKVIAIQRGIPDAFSPYVFDRTKDIEVDYIDGVSITHGPAGSRQHIWSFAAVGFEAYFSHALHSYCPCTNTSVNLPPNQIPSFVGNDYFCDTGDHSSQPIGRWHPEDPLWDGEGCGPYSTCCEFNNPPWFCRALPQPTTNDVELRICGNSPITDEDAVLTLVDISVIYV